MKQRLNYYAKIPHIMEAVMELNKRVHESSLGNTIIDLVNIRASQLNGCTFCVDMHNKEAKIHGERELRLYHIAVWRESHLFTDKERAVLEWTEVVTRLTDKGIDDKAYEDARAHLSEQEISELTVMISVINTWNRLSVAFRAQHGSMDKMMGLDKAGLE